MGQVEDPEAGCQRGATVIDDRETLRVFTLTMTLGALHGCEPQRDDIGIGIRRQPIKRLRTEVVLHLGAG